MLAVLLVALTVLLAACGGDEPTATQPPPQATATTAPTATPARSIPPRSGQVTVQVLASLAFMSEIVEPMRRILNESDSFVKLQVQDVTGGPGGSMAALAQFSAAEQQLTTAWTLENDWNLAIEGLGGYERRFPGGLKPRLEVLMKVGPLGCSGVGTLDPNIVDYADLDGKTLQHGTRISERFTDPATAIGINVNHVNHGDDNVTIRELKNGQIDASYYHMTGHNRPVPVLLQLLQEKKGAFYFVDVADSIVATQEKFPGKWPFMFPVPLFRGELKETWNLEVDPIRGDVFHCHGGQNPFFSVSPDMPDDVAYEIVYQTVKSRERFAEFLGGDIAAITETLGMTYAPRSRYHAGARKAFEDLGYPYGLEATIEHQKERAQKHGLAFEVPESFQRMLAEEAGK